MVRVGWSTSPAEVLMQSNPFMFQNATCVCACVRVCVVCVCECMKQWAGGTCVHTCICVYVRTYVYMYVFMLK